MRSVARSFPLDGPLDLALTLGPLRRGPGDPTLRLGATTCVRGTRTPDGPATVHLAVDGDRVEARAWGPGAGRALEGVPELVGLHDRAVVADAPHPIVRRLQRALPGLRVGKTGAVLEALLPAILEQKVTTIEAGRAFRRIVLRFGEPAPGPDAVMVAPDPRALAAQPYHAFHELGVERRRADVIRAVCAHAGRVEAAAAMAPADARRRLTAFPGVGEWTAAEVTARALGDPDAVSVGDFHLPHLVAWALAGEPRGDDRRMLTLLEPYRGQRGRVIRLLEVGAPRPPRRAPRRPLRRFERI